MNYHRNGKKSEQHGKKHDIHVLHHTEWDTIKHEIGLQA